MLETAKLQQTHRFLRAQHRSKQVEIDSDGLCMQLIIQCDTSFCTSNSRSETSASVPLSLGVHA